MPHPKDPQCLQTFASLTKRKTDGHGRFTMVILDDVQWGWQGQKREGSVQKWEVARVETPAYIVHTRGLRDRVRTTRVLLPSFEAPSRLQPR